MSKDPKKTRGYDDNEWFRSIFGKYPSTVTESMDLAGDDVASQTPSLQLRINRVGCDLRKTYVTFNNLFENNSEKDLMVSIDAGVGVAENIRGIHVSRLSDCIARLSENHRYGSLDEFTRALAEDIKKTQKTDSVRLSAEAEYIETSKVISGNSGRDKLTQDRIGLISKVTLSSEANSFSTGIRVGHITACPCVQQMFKHATGINTGFPNLTHSQRAITELSLSNLEYIDVSNGELLECADAVLTRIRDTLPRPAELATVFQAHAKPQFIEDVVRDLATEAFKVFGERIPESLVHIKSRSMESIHTFDMTAELNTSMRQIQAALVK